MTQEKHTQWPWSIELGRNGWDDNASIIGADGSFVAQVQWTNDSHQGNASLISAAPELLEALKKLASIDFGSHGWDEFAENAAREARAAIAKATGTNQ